MSAYWISQFHTHVNEMQLVEIFPPLEVVSAPFLDALMALWRDVTPRPLLSDTAVPSGLRDLHYYSNDPQEDSLLLGMLQGLCQKLLLAYLLWFTGLEKSSFLNKSIF